MKVKIVLFFGLLFGFAVSAQSLIITNNENRGLNFGEVRVGTTKTETLELKNNGNQPIIISSVIFSSETLSSNITLPLELAPNATASFNLTASPTSLQRESLYFTIKYNSEEDYISKVYLKPIQ